MALNRSTSLSAFWLAQLLLLSSLVLLFVGAAHADSIKLEETTFRIERGVERGSGEDPYAISYKDCLDDDPSRADLDPRNPKKDARTWIRFPINRTDVNTNNSRLEIWVSQGADCKDPNERSSTNRCHRVFQDPDISVGTATTYTARVYPRLVVDSFDTDNSLGGEGDYPDESVCDLELEVGLNFYVLVFVGDEYTAEALWNQTKLDLLGPLPPESISLAGGEENLFVKWSIPTASEDPDTQGFAIYCAEADSSPGIGGAGNGCGTSLVAGERPPLTDPTVFECGSANGRTTREGKAGGLQNGSTYAVAVAGRDRVNNSGALSEVECMAPQEVTSFFEAYREADGKGGGGYCSYGRSPLSGGLLICAAFFSLARFYRRLRRSTSVGSTEAQP